jgi:hypothetical protein
MINEADVESYVRQAGKELALIQIFNEWSVSSEFPRAEANWIRCRGAVPYIRLYLRSSKKQEDAPHECKYTLKRIIHEDWDEQLTAWAEDAKRFGKPLVVEYGNECNGQSFPWCGTFNGGPGVGPKQFVRAYRHIISLMRDQVGAKNITWVFHVNYDDNPNEKWNFFEHYYPDTSIGEASDNPEVDYIDWLAVSCYGPQTPLQDYEPDTFRTIMDGVYCRFGHLDAKKPVFVAEFGCTSGYFENHPEAPQFRPEVWALDALNDLFARKWPKVIGFSWWNSSWTNDKDPANDSNMRLENIYPLSRVFRRALEQNKASIIEYPESEPAP